MLNALEKEKQGWLGWAIFLGMSWTWCIGMYLPMLLIHDYGTWAWIVFAIPNVLGAAAMGWMISAPKSRAIIQAHRPAITVFSTITVAFQLFFAGWIFSRPQWQAAGRTWYLLGVCIVGVAATVRRSARVLAVVILLASIVCVIGMFHHGEARIRAIGVINHLEHTPPLDVILLIPLTVFGFVLCPYLDGSFHLARQQLSDDNAKKAFAVGFCVFFGAAILLTLLYARPVHVAMDSHQRVPLILQWVKIYWMLQLGFTVGVHLAGEPTSDAKESARRIAILASIAIVIAGAGLLVGQFFELSGENVYRAFLGFYGLAAPAYVWLCLIPGGGVMAPSSRSLKVFAAATVIASPMFAMAFIERRLVWGIPGVAVVLLARVFLTTQKSPASEVTAGGTLHYSN